MARSHSSNAAPRLPMAFTALLLLLAAAAAVQPARASKGEPKTMNPYANKPYAGCEGGYCAPAKPAAEAALYRAAASGGAAEVRAALADPQLNLTRNIVPDADGFARVLDVAVWTAAGHGRVAAMEELLKVKAKRDYEDGHVVDLAAANGDTEMLALLLREGFHVGSASLAYAAKHKNADMVKALLKAAKERAKGKEPDLKAAMQAACAAGDDGVLRALVDEGAFKEILHPVSKRPLNHDWRGDYVFEAVATGHPRVVEMLFNSGYSITWQNAEELVKLAARVGNADSLRLLLTQPTIADDADELEEAVENALKVAAEEGREAAVEYLVTAHPALCKAPCPAATLRATMYGHFGVTRLLSRACNVSESSPKLQAAGWLGALFNAARGGHADTARLLLAHADADTLLGKIYAHRKPKKGGPPVAPDPEKDPLAIAAARGHLQLVQLLSPRRALCAPCAAAAAAGAGHVEIFAHLAAGPARSVLDGDEDKIQDALRCAAAAMEGGHWRVADALLSGHDSDRLGPYFLPAIAQQGRLEDLKQMMALIEKVGCSEPDYLVAQLNSAIVSAALSGHEEMLLALQEVRADVAQRLEGGDGDDEGGGGSGSGGDSGGEKKDEL